MTTQLTNRFADPDQSTELAVLSDNPYAPPVVRRRGKYDHSLYWRIMKFCGLLIIGFLILDAVVLLSYLDTFEQQGSFWQSVKEFLFNWDAAKVPH